MGFENGFRELERSDRLKELIHEAVGEIVSLKIERHGNDITDQEKSAITEEGFDAVGECISDLSKKFSISGFGERDRDVLEGLMIASLQSEGVRPNTARKIFEELVRQNIRLVD